jgi:hypothetical protein
MSASVRALQQNVSNLIFDLFHSFFLLSPLFNDFSFEIAEMVHNKAQTMRRPENCTRSRRWPSRLKSTGLGRHPHFELVGG